MVVACPVCDGQGNIYKARIVDLGIVIKICDECEACWKDDQPIDSKNFKGLTLFLKTYGLAYETAKIEDLEYLE